jgi:hypothetical protein
MFPERLSIKGDECVRPRDPEMLRLGYVVDPLPVAPD